MFSLLAVLFNSHPHDKKIVVGVKWFCMRRFGPFQGVTHHSDLLKQNYFALHQAKSRVSSSVSGDPQKQYVSLLNSINQQLSTGQPISREHLQNLRQLVSGVGM